MTAGLSQAMSISARILEQKNISTVSQWAVKKLKDRALLPKYAPVLPRDQASLVDEIVRRLSTTPPSISLETAVAKLGDGPSEVTRIQEDLQDEVLHPKPVMGEAKKVPGGNSGVGNEPTKVKDE
jgi:hypothetical protein